MQRRIAHIAHSRTCQENQRRLDAAGKPDRNPIPGTKASAVQLLCNGVDPTQRLTECQPRIDVANGKPIRSLLRPGAQQHVERVRTPKSSRVERSSLFKIKKRQDRIHRRCKRFIWLGPLRQSSISSRRRPSHGTPRNMHQVGFGQGHATCINCFTALSVEPFHHPSDCVMLTTTATGQTFCRSKETNEMPALTAELGHFVSSLTLADIPPEAQAVAKTGITDCFGVMIAGARDPVVALLDREMAGSDGTALASLIPSGKKRNVEDAALVNGAAAHVLDYDDVTLDGHPSAVLVPAIMAQGEAGGASGSELLTAYVAGYEVWAELLVREPVPLHQKGWHPTAVRGAVAAAAACAKLRRLSPEKMSDGIGHRRFDGGGSRRQFRQPDEVLSSRPRCSIRGHRGAACRCRTDGLARRARTSVGLPRCALSNRAGRPVACVQSAGKRMAPRAVRGSTSSAIRSATPPTARSTPHWTSPRTHDLKATDIDRHPRLDWRDADAHGPQRTAEDRVRGKVQHAVRDGIVAGRA